MVYNEENLILIERTKDFTEFYDEKEFVFLLDHTLSPFKSVYTRARYHTPYLVSISKYLQGITDAANVWGVAFKHVSDFIDAGLIKAAKSEAKCLLKNKYAIKPCTLSSFAYMTMVHDVIRKKIGASVLHDYGLKLFRDGHAYYLYLHEDGQTLAELGELKENETQLQKLSSEKFYAYAVYADRPSGNAIEQFLNENMKLGGARIIYHHNDSILICKSGVYYDNELYRVPFNLDGLTDGEDLLSVYGFIYDETNTYEHALKHNAVPWAVMELLQEAGLSVDMIASFEVYAKSRAKDTYAWRLLEENVYVYAEDVFVLPEERKEFVTEYLQLRVPKEIVVKDCAHVSYDTKVYTLTAKKTGSPVFYGKWSECVQFICLISAADEHRR